MRYRAPEVLLGASFYTSAVDVWAAGPLESSMSKKFTLDKSFFLPDVINVGLSRRENTVHSKRFSMSLAKCSRELQSW